MNEEERNAMIFGATECLNYLKDKPFSEPEVVIKHIVKSFKQNPKKKGLSLLAIVSADEMLKLKRQDLSSNNRQIMEQFLNKMKDIYNRVVKFEDN
jgi:hypothetical protein